MTVFEEMWPIQLYGRRLFFTPAMIYWTPTVVSETFERQEWRLTMVAKTGFQRLQQSLSGGLDGGQHRRKLSDGCKVIRVTDSLKLGWRST